MKLSFASLPQPNRHAGPSLLLLAVVYTCLMLAGVRSGGLFKILSDSPANAVAYIAAHGASMQWGSFFELGSAIPLGIFIATVVSRLRFFGVRAAGESIAFLGGTCATLMLLLSALSGWSTTRPGIAEVPGTVRVLEAFAFLGGGPGFVVALGLFLAGVSIPAGLHKMIPRWLMVLGIVIAAACELASFSLVNFNMVYCIPVGRFLSVIWMFGVALTLPSTLAQPASEVAPNPEGKQS